MKQVKITIIAHVTTTVTLNEGETIEQLKNRDVDIYLHDGGKFGFRDKQDLGADSTTIIVHDDSTETNREIALGLWNTFNHNVQTILFNTYKLVKFTPANNPNELTGREIEYIFENILEK